MALTLYAHPFASYCWKAMIALYENNTPFTLHVIDLGDAASAAELEQLWPFRKFPVLVDGGKSVIESTIIIEYLDLHHAGAIRLVPDNAAAALEVRFADFFSTIMSTRRCRRSSPTRCAERNATPMR